MSDIQIILDEKNTLTFGVDIQGIRTKRLESRFIVEGSEMDLSFEGKFDGDEVIVEIPILAQTLEPDTYRCKLEFIIEGEKFFVPMITEAEFIMPVKVRAGITNTSSHNIAKRKEITGTINVDEDNFKVTSTPAATPVDELDLNKETATKTSDGIETKNLTFEIKAIKEDGSFEGYGSVFGVKDSYNDIVEKGAFTKTLKERKNVKLLWQHDTKEPIGVFEKMYEDDHGLVVKGQIALDVQRGREAYTLMKMGALDGLSIGYSTIKEQYNRKENVRYLKELKLFEVSVVTFPANEVATVTSVKGEFETLNTDDKELVFDFVKSLEIPTEPCVTHSVEDEDNYNDVKSFIQSLQSYNEPCDPHSVKEEADNKKSSDIDALEQFIQSITQKEE